MKKFFLSILLLSGVTICFNSCSNGPYNADPNGNVSNLANPIFPTGSVVGTCVCKAPLSADIDGTEWISDSNATFSVATVGGVTVATISGTDTGHKYTVLITVQQYAGAGSFALNLGSLAGAGIVDVSTSTPYSSEVTGGSGTLIIQSDANGYATGNFSYKALTADGSKSHTITGGYFKLKH